MLMINYDKIGLNMIIAVIDDEELILDVFSQILDRQGLEAEFFDHPQKALQSILASPEKYALVVCDVIMPDMDGITFAKRLRAALPEFPIMFMSGDSSEEIIETVEKMGRTVFLEKPFSLADELERALFKLLPEKTR